MPDRSVAASTLRAMTTISTPTELITAVPFLLNCSPEDSLVVIALSNGALEAVIQVPLPENFHFSGEEQFFADLRASGADQLLVLAYLPDQKSNDSGQPGEPDPLSSDGWHQLQGLCEQIAPVKDFLLIHGRRWRSFLCIDDGCCDPAGQALPDIASSLMAAEHVFEGRVMPPLTPFEDHDSALMRNIHVAESEFLGCAPQMRSRRGVIALLRLISHYRIASEVKDLVLLADALVALNDIQVRDFGIGSHGDDHLALHRQLWGAMVELAPDGYRAPVATLFALLSYEAGDSKGARVALERALSDDPHYSLAHLLQKTFAAGWPPEAFTTMRHELHPKLRAELLG